jgi:LmbE family N-acetylglucosaminyl deacetylase
LKHSAQNSSTQIVFISPHPDDETLGCGGTILKHHEEGNAIHWVIVTGMAEKQGFSPEVIVERQKEINTVAGMYGVTAVHNLNLPAAQLDTIPTQELISRLGTLFNEIKPQSIYLPNRSDVHSDHRVVFSTAWSCCKTFRYPFIRRVLMYETLSETDYAPPLCETAFFPNSFSDISSFLERKIEIMRIYKGEMEEHPFPRSEHTIRSLATIRGATAGVEYAEAFMLLKEIR